MKLLLAGCGIFKHEISWLIEKNKWPLELIFLDSSLHMDFDRLAAGLTGTLNKLNERDVIVFYGTCHPLMDKILENHNTFRTEGQNCVEILLGHEKFTEELEKGAYFLFEDWALRWNYIIASTFGTDKKEIIRDIFQQDRKYLLAIRTICSGDFSFQAMDAANMVGLPLFWMDASLDHLERVLNDAISKKMR